jgi:pimeloyl-ACP methyl ester carboxylesterase
VLRVARRRRSFRHAVNVEVQGGAAPLLDRRREQRLLASLLDAAASRGQALVLGGDPGIGKSRLLSEAARGAEARGMTVLTSAGVQSETHLPFAGLHQLLRPVRDRAADLPAAQRAALDAAFGVTDEVAPERFRIAMAVLDLLSDVATEAPLLVIADDAQWLDRPTSEPAWRSKPTWYLVSTDDRMIPPPAQRAMAQRAGATLTEAAGSHSIYVSQPAVVADVIAQAARSLREAAGVA